MFRYSVCANQIGSLTISPNILWGLISAQTVHKGNISRQALVESVKAILTVEQDR